MSDSHNDYQTASLVVSSNPDAQLVIHCGDGANELIKLKHEYNDKQIIGVRGNCDLTTELPEDEIIEVLGKKIFINHGFKYSVKYSVAALLCKAREVSADIVVYGHTHDPECDVRAGIHVMNPGSVRGKFGTYGVIDIDGSGIVMNILAVKDLQ